jgi:hypothetical protein
MNSQQRPAIENFTMPQNLPFPILSFAVMQQEGLSGRSAMFCLLESRCHRMSSTRIGKIMSPSLAMRTASATSRKHAIECNVAQAKARTPRATTTQLIVVRALYGEHIRPLMGSYRPLVPLSIT